MTEKKVNFNDCVGLLGLGNRKKGIILFSGFYADKDESEGLYRNFISYLHRHDYSTLRYDDTAIGESPGDIENVGLQNWLYDSYKATDFFINEGVERIGLLGFSIGAVKAIKNYSRGESIQKRIETMAFWSPTFNPRNDMLERYKDNGDYDKAIQGLMKKNGKNVTRRMLDSLNFDIIDELVMVNCPVLICHSRDDPYIPIDSSISSSKIIKKLDDFIILDGSGHSFRSLKDDGDLSEREYVYNRTIQFFNERL